MRVYRRLHVRLPKRHRDKLDNVLRGGIQPVRVVLRALALSQLHQGKAASDVADNVRLTSKAVRETGPQGRTRDNSDLVARTRPSAVAGKKCGASPSSMTNTSRRWKMCWKSMKGRCLPKSRWCA